MNKIAMTALGVLAAASLCAAGEKLNFSAPVMRKAPLLDGKISPGEWAESLSFDGMRQHNGGALEWRRAKAFIGTDGKALYLALETELPEDRSLVTGKQRKGVQACFEDIAEFFIDPDPDAASGINYHLLVNAAGNTDFDALPRGKAEKPDWSRGGLEFRQSKENGNWTIEVKIPLTLFKRGIGGSPWGISICRSWMRPLVFSSIPGQFNGENVRIVFSPASRAASADSVQSHLDDEILPPPTLAVALPLMDFRTSADALETGITLPAFSTGREPKLGPKSESYRGSPRNACHTARGESATKIEINAPNENAALFIPAPPFLKEPRQEHYRHAYKSRPDREPRQKPRRIADCGEHARPPAVAVRHLVESPAAEGARGIHRHDLLRPVFAARKFNPARKALRGRARIPMLDGKIRELNAERKLDGLARRALFCADHDGVGRHSLPQDERTLHPHKILQRARDYQENERHVRYRRAEAEKPPADVPPAARQNVDDRRKPDERAAEEREFQRAERTDAKKALEVFGLRRGYPDFPLRERRNENQKSRVNHQAHGEPL